MCLICQQFGMAGMELTHEYSLSLNNKHEEGYVNTVQRLA